MVAAGDDAKAAEWFPLAKVLAEFDMAFDHKEILKTFMAKFRPGSDL